LEGDGELPERAELWVDRWEAVATARAVRETVATGTTDNSGSRGGSEARRRPCGQHHDFIAYEDNLELEFVRLESCYFTVDGRLENGPA
jgi:hypothetical protein